MQQRFLLQILLFAKPLLHLVGILFPHINDDARSKSHQSWEFCHFAKVSPWNYKTHFH